MFGASNQRDPVHGHDVSHDAANGDLSVGPKAFPYVRNILRNYFMRMRSRFRRIFNKRIWS